MFGIGMPEMLLICAVALIVIGPKKLPDLAKSLGRAFGEFKRATSDLKESLEIDTDLSDVSKPFDEITDDIKDSLDSPADSVAYGSSESDPPKDNDDNQETEPADSDSTDSADDEVGPPVVNNSDTDIDTDKPPEAVKEPEAEEGLEKDDRVG